MVKMLILRTPLLEHLRYRARGGPVGTEGSRDGGTEVGGEEAHIWRMVGGEFSVVGFQLLKIGPEWRVLVVFAWSGFGKRTAEALRAQR